MHTLLYTETQTGGLLTITLAGGQGRSAKLNCFVENFEADHRSECPKCPAIVDSSPGEKVSIVVLIVVAPHQSFA